MFDPLLVEAIVAASILPDLTALTILQVILPVTFILGSVHVGVRPKTMGFVLLPLTIEYVAIGVPKNAPSICLIVPPSSLILGPVWPYLHPEAVPLLPQPLTLIDGPIFESMLRPELKLTFLIVSAARGHRQGPVTHESRSGGLRIGVIGGVVGHHGFGGGHQATLLGPVSFELLADEVASEARLDAHDQVHVSQKVLDSLLVYVATFIVHALLDLVLLNGELVVLFDVVAATASLTHFILVYWPLF